MLEVILIIICVLVVLGRFSSTETGQAPLLDSNEESDGFSLLGSLFSVGLIVFFSLGALAVDTDAFAFTSFVIAIGCFGLLLFVNGIAKRLSLIFFLACIAAGFIVGGMAGAI